MIDWDRVAELQDEVGEEDFAEVLWMFFDEFEETLGTMTSGDDKEKLHFLKGSAANVGMEQVAELCKTAEIAVAEGKISESHVPSIKSAFEESRAALLEMVA